MSIERKLYRLRWEDFVRKHRKYFKRPDVVCAPSSETPLSEIIESYSRLGIKENNIRLLLPSKRLEESKEFSCKVSDRPVHEWFESNEDELGIVDLDYKGPVSFKTIDVLGEISRVSGKYTLVNHCYKAQGEKPETIELLFYNIMDFSRDLKGKSFSKFFSSAGFNLDELIDLYEGFKIYGPESLLPGDSVSPILSLFEKGTDPDFVKQYGDCRKMKIFEVKKFINEHHDNLDIIRALGLGVLSQGLFISGHEAYSFLPEHDRCLPKDHAKKLMDCWGPIIPKPLFFTTLNFGIRPKLNAYLDTLPLLERILSPAWRKREPRLLIDLQQLKFISNSSPFMGQFLFLEKYDNKEMIEIIYRLRKDAPRMKLRGDKRKVNQYIKEMDNWHSKYYEKTAKYKRSYDQYTLEHILPEREISRIVTSNKNIAQVAVDLYALKENFKELDVGEALQSQLPNRYKSVFSAKVLSALLPQLNLGVYGRGNQPVASKSVEELLSTYADVFAVSPDLLKKTMTRLNIDSVQKLTTPDAARKYIEGL